MIPEDPPNEIGHKLEQRRGRRVRGVQSVAVVTIAVVMILTVAWQLLLFFKPALVHRYKKPVPVHATMFQSKMVSLAEPDAKACVVSVHSTITNRGGRPFVVIGQRVTARYVTTGDLHRTAVVAPAGDEDPLATECPLEKTGLIVDDLQDSPVIRPFEAASVEQDEAEPFARAIVIPLKCLSTGVVVVAARFYIEPNDGNNESDHLCLASPQKAGVCRRESCTTATCEAFSGDTRMVDAQAFLLTPSCEILAPKE